MATKTRIDYRRITRKIPGYDPWKTKGKCKFDGRAAGRAIAFFHECLTHVKGPKAGQPFILEPWQHAVIANIFGWKRPDGTRRYREVLMFVPRKNGKSLLAAGVCLFCLFCDGEIGAEIYCAAAERDQASLVWNMAKRQVLNEPVLERNCKIYNALKSIVIDSNGSFCKPISAEADTKHGFNVHMACIDELHVQRTSELVDVLETGTGARTQPLILYVTTSDYQRESICNTKYEYAAKVRDGVIDDPAFLPVIYEADLKDNWRLQKVWKKANPNLGISVFMEYLKRECKKAQEMPTRENAFKRLHLNIRTEQDVRWLPMDLWRECGDSINIDELEGRPCYGGLDLASTRDLCSFKLFFPEDGNAVVSYFWVPKASAVERQKRDRVPYLTWAKQKHIKLTRGNVVDYDVIRDDVNLAGQQFDIRQIAIDRWNSTQLQTQLKGDGFDVVPFGQGFASMSAPSKELEKLILAKDIRHGNQPVLNWCASNVMVEMDAAGNIKPSKKKSSEKIDGIVSLIMAIGLAMVDEDSGPSVYEERGIVSL